MKIVTVEEMIRREAAVIVAGTSAEYLMERAAIGMRDAIRRSYPHAAEFAIFVGKGNNGGDGIVLARLLCEATDNPVAVHLTCPRDELGHLPRRKLEELEQAAPDCRIIPQGERPCLPLSDGLIIDALLGVGAQGRLRGLLADLVETLNSHRRTHFCRTVALDTPTGLLGIADEPYPEEDTALVADLTLTVGWVKEPLTRETLSNWVGRLEGIPLFDNDPENGDVLITPPDIASLLPRRSSHSHKNTFGRALIIGGCEGFLGAPLMATHAALRLGAGLVNVAVPPDLVAAAAMRAMPEAMVGPRRLDDALAAEMSACAAVALGPGLGRSSEAEETVRWVLAQAQKPLVIDADALTILAQNLLWLREAKVPVLMTPHPGEMKRLLGGRSFSDAERPDVAREFAQSHGVTLILKGTRTLVAAPNQPLWINGTGNAGLATGGSGDTLTGMLAALLSQGLTTHDAARLGVWLHGHAADRVLCNIGSEESLLPSDLAEALGSALASLRHQAA